MTERAISQADLVEQFRSFERSAFRCEQQPSYEVPEEATSVAMFADGVDHDPTEDPYFREGFALFAELTESGRRLERVRVHDEPPTTYQRWLLWLGRWNAEAGEVIHYLNREVALDAGLVPADGYGDDFWLFDDQLVVIMQFDGRGRLMALTSSDESETVAAAVEWRRRARLHVPGSTPDPV